MSKLFRGSNLLLILFSRQVPRHLHSAETHLSQVDQLHPLNFMMRAHLKKND